MSTFVNRISAPILAPLGRNPTGFSLERSKQVFSMEHYRRLSKSVVRLPSLGLSKSAPAGFESLNTP
jgi:hypothetical protein